MSDDMQDDKMTNNIVQHSMAKKTPTPQLTKEERGRLIVKLREEHTPFWRQTDLVNAIVQLMLDEGQDVDPETRKSVQVQVSKLETGKIVKCDFLPYIEKIFDRLLSAKGDPRPSDLLARMRPAVDLGQQSGIIPVKMRFFRASAGEDGGFFMGQAAEFITGGPIELSGNSEAYGVEIIIENLIPKFPLGSIAWVNPKLTPQPGNYVIAVPQNPIKNLQRFILQFIQETESAWILRRLTDGIDLNLSKFKWPVLHVIVTVAINVLGDAPLPSL